MKADDYEALVRSSVERRLAIAKKKRADYASTEDVLANFKRLGEAVRVLRINQLWDKEPALAYGLFMEVMKADRLVNILLKSTTPQNESLQDSWNDALNYADLAHAIYVESEEIKKRKVK